MNGEQQQELLSLLRNKQYATVEELAASLFVSPSTIRRRLNLLQQKGLVTRKHGGASLNSAGEFSPSFTFRIHQNGLEKKKIALAAIKLIKDGDFVFLDGTTTSFYIAERLSEFENVRVITNGIETLSLLSKEGVTAYSTGGMIQKENRSVLVGRYAENFVNDFHADIAFFSAQSLSENGEISDCFEEENFIRKAMLKHARCKVFLCDSTKFGKTSRFRLGTIEEMDYIVTNAPLTGFSIPEKVVQIVTE